MRKIIIFGPAAAHVFESGHGLCTGRAVTKKKLTKKKLEWGHFGNAITSIFWHCNVIFPTIEFSSDDLSRARSNLNNFTGTARQAVAGSD